MQPSTVEFWSGEFGDSYVERNRISPLKRQRFWDDVIPGNVANVLEVGCNIATNLKAIRAVRPEMECVGVDVNERALLEAASAGIEAHRLPAAQIVDHFGPRAFDLTLTAGVLIHVEPEALKRTMEAIIETSKRYVIAVEYAFPTEQEVEYRGHAGKLWKRPYAKLYEGMGLRLLRYGFAGERDGFDDCAWALLERESLELTHGLRGMAD